MRADSIDYGHMKKATLNIVALLTEADHSLYWLANEAKIDYKTLSKHSKGKSSSVRLDHIARLCEALECSPADLFTITEKRHERKAKKSR